MLAFTYLALKIGSSLSPHFNSLLNNLQVNFIMRNMKKKDGRRLNVHKLKHYTILERSMAWSVSSIFFIPASISCWLDIAAKQQNIKKLSENDLSYTISDKAKKVKIKVATRN